MTHKRHMQLVLEQGFFLGQGNWHILTLLYLSGQIYFLQLTFRIKHSRIGEIDILAFGEKGV